MSSRKKKKQKPGRRTDQQTSNRRFPVLRIAPIVVILAVAASLVIYHLKQSDPDGAPSPDSGVSKGRRVASSEKGGNFQNLIGRWQRPDGGYVIEIRKVDSEGRMDAAYFNPRPIHVSRADASWKEGVQQVFLELRDKGYPGSTYTLVYNQTHDMLAGIYFQAAMRQSFDVVFVRTK